MAKKLSKRIKELRTEQGLSQEYIAQRLGFSRPTYMQIEKGGREVTISEAERLAGIFDISLEGLLNEKKELCPVVEIKAGKKKIPPKKEAIRISVPQKKAEKFEQTLLYILSKIGGKPNIGQTVLYKLLYFIDFDYYEKYEEQLIGAKYIKNTHGPTPIMFAKIIERLEKEGRIERLKSKFYKYEQTKYLVNPKKPMDVSALSSQELAHIDWEIGRLGDLTATQISVLSHVDTPWIAAGDREPLEYEHVFYRPDETSVREYEEL